MSDGVFSLDLDVARTRADIDLAEIEAAAADLAEQRERAAAQADRLLSVDPNDHDERAQALAAVDQMGRDVERLAATRAKTLQAPLQTMSHVADDGGPIATSLADLREQVDRLDPSHLEADTGWWARLVGRIPGVGSPLRRYFLRYESSQTRVDAIVRSLENSRDQLQRDNITLQADQAVMRELTATLAEQIAAARALDAAVEERLTTLATSEATAAVAAAAAAAFGRDEILFTIRQRTLDLQQQLTVTQQAILATEVIICNNRELIRGVDRSINVTVSALQVAVTVAMALERQQLVLDKIEAINATTSSLIAGTADRLRTQGTDIHHRAAGSMVDMDALRSAFADIDGALDEISRYRRDALPKMEAQVSELDRLSTEQAAALDQLGTRMDGATDSTGLGSGLAPGTATGG